MIVLYFYFFHDRHEKCGNEQFFVELSKWVFHERGHLKVCSFSEITDVFDITVWCTVILNTFLNFDFGDSHVSRL